MALKGRINLVTIVFQGVSYIVYYSRSENHDVSLFHVKVGSLELNEFTGPMFTISWLNETGLISYLIGGPTDLEIKCTIVQAIFKKEHIKS